MIECGHGVRLRAEKRRPGLDCRVAPQPNLPCEREWNCSVPVPTLSQHEYAMCRDRAIPDVRIQISRRGCETVSRLAQISLAFSYARRASPSVECGLWIVALRTAYLFLDKADSMLAA